LTTLGLLSDSHGRADTTQTAVQALLDHGADMLVHLGDIGSTGVLDALAAVNPKTGEQIQAHIVLGNTDWDAGILTRYATDLGIEVHDITGLLVIDQKQVGITHGHLGSAVQDLIDAEVDYLLQGHTHIQADRRIGKTRLINPGALFRASRLTFALLTPSSGKLEVLEVASVSRLG